MVSYRLDDLRVMEEMILMFHVIFIGLAGCLIAGIIFLLCSYEGEDEDLEHCLEDEV